MPDSHILHQQDLDIYRQDRFWNRVPVNEELLETVIEDLTNETQSLEEFQEDIGLLAKMALDDLNELTSFLLLNTTSNLDLGTWILLTIVCRQIQRLRNIAIDMLY